MNSIGSFDMLQWLLGK